MAAPALVAAGATTHSVSAAEQPVPVVATISIIADFVRNVGGGNVAARSIVGPDQDPHEYQPRPSDVLKIRDARLLVVNGLGLEGWLDRLIATSGFKGPRVVATEGITPRMLGNITDPHAWQDPRNALIYVANIAKGLQAVDPSRADAYKAAADDYSAKLRALDEEVEKIIDAVPPAKRKVITSHDAFGYYGARYGIDIHGVQGVSTEGEPSARELARLAQQVRAEHIRALFIENMTDPRYARALAREAGTVVVGPPVYSDALSKPGGPADTYLKMLRYNSEQFARAMQANEVS